MADALRWDHLPDSVREYGLTVKTVAASLATHTSLPSMISGLYPQRHGVFSWQDQIPEVEHLLNRQDLKAGYFQPGRNPKEDGTFPVLDVRQNTSLAELIESGQDWVYFERHHGGHAPFNAIEPWEGSWDEWVDKYAGNLKQYRRDYQRAITHTVEDFEDRYKLIENNGLIEDTLIVFTSDHGELLGERGLLGHSTPQAPESVYVPTIFIHPDLPANKEVPGIMRHIDLYPSLLSALDEDIPDFVDGKSLTETQPSSGYSIGVGNFYYSDTVRQFWLGQGVWDENGGYTFSDPNIINKFFSIFNKLYNQFDRSHHLRRRSLRDFVQSVRPYLRESKQFGSPNFTEEYARDTVDTISKLPPVAEQSKQEISQETKDHLQELGYL